MYSKRYQKTLLIFNAIYSRVTNTPTLNDTNSIIPSTSDLLEETIMPLFQSFYWRHY